MNHQLLFEIDLRPRAAAGWRGHFATTWAVRLTDGLVLLFASQLALLTRFDDLSEFSRYGPYAVLIGLLLAANVFSFLGLYKRRTLFAVRTIMQLAPAWALVLLVLIAIGYGTRTAGDISRLWVALWFAFGAAGLVVARGCGAWLNNWSPEAAGPSRRIAVLGSGTARETVVRRLSKRNAGNCELVGIFGDDTDTAAMRWLRRGSVGDLVDLCRDGLIDEIVIVDDGGKIERLGQWLDIVRQLPVNVSVVPTIGDRCVPLRGIRRLGELDVISVAERPLAGLKGLAKRAEDIIVAALVIVLAAPLMVLVALVIKLDSRGPVFFRQRRYGFNNEQIEVLKFRSMRVDAAADGTGELRQASREDPRVTRVGRWLRRSSLDELPQFFQVLSGKMSVVGPRPHAVAHHQKYVELIEFYESRHRVKPGITGWAQINGWRGETTTVEMMKKRIEFDIYYIENWSISLDIMIILKTVLTGLASKNAY